MAWEGLTVSMSSLNSLTDLLSIEFTVRVGSLQDLFPSGMQEFPDWI